MAEAGTACHSLSSPPLFLSLSPRDRGAGKMPSSGTDEAGQTKEERGRPGRGTLETCFSFLAKPYSYGVIVGPLRDYSMTVPLFHLSGSSVDTVTASHSRPHPHGVWHTGQAVNSYRSHWAGAPVPSDSDILLSQGMGTQREEQIQSAPQLREATEIHLRVRRGPARGTSGSVWRRF